MEAAAIPIPLTFGDFPEDVQLCVLSFLRPSDLAVFASTCKRFVSLYRHDQRLWFSMCDRRWGSKTLINKWGGGKISYKRLYRILDEYENLIGFWRRCGDSVASPPPLVFFEWGPSYISGSRISPARNRGYEVVKKPFLWMSVASDGQPVSYLDPDGRCALTEGDLMDESGILESELIHVNVCFIGECHVVLEENLGLPGFSKAPFLGNSKTEEYENVYGSPPDSLMTEIYQYFANRTSPGGNGASRRQRRREKEKQGRMKRWEPEHFVKIVNCSPKPGRPLQGLWKGICDDTSLDFYLVSYDDVGGIACRKVGDSSRPLAYNAPVFWTSSSTFIECPFSVEEDLIYKSRLHLRPPPETDHSLSTNDAVTRMLYINSSYDLVIPGATLDPQQVEGRIWQYQNGTFGFGFLRDSYIIDLRRISENGRLLDAAAESSNG
ncbi:F-box protein At3g12350 [Andrographis paniculata]|uniref:F-box protein At3g12350 n=1 Tax=Andrographis paniculata TaxID=175694 RepID=UPI0021E78061|nr:F-box protein At3g12350 [Andrographis paniculata]